MNHIKSPEVVVDKDPGVHYFLVKTDDSLRQTLQTLARSLRKRCVKVEENRAEGHLRNRICQRTLCGGKPRREKSTISFADTRWEETSGAQRVIAFTVIMFHLVPNPTEVQ